MEAAQTAQAISEILIRELTIKKGNMQGCQYFGNIVIAEIYLW